VLEPRQPFPGRWLKHGVIVKADTLAELANGVRPVAVLGDTNQIR